MVDVKVIQVGPVSTGYKVYIIDGQRFTEVGLLNMIQAMNRDDFWIAVRRMNGVQ